MSPSERPAGEQLVSLSVAAVARRLGVAPATLRTWDRRYGLGPSEHEPGSHRRYTKDDVARLVVMRRLTLEGVAPVQAAATAQVGTGPRGEQPDDPAAQVSAPADRVHADEPAAAWTTAVAMERTPLTRRASPAGADDLQRAALAGDAALCTSLVLQAASSRGPLAAWEGLVAPALHALGRRWEVTSPGVDTDVLLRAATLEALRQLRVPVPRTSSVVVVAAPEHEPAGLTLHALAAAVRADGVSAWVLAAGLPREAVAAAVRRTGPMALVLHAQRLVTDPAAQLAVLPRLRTPARLILSGPGWARARVEGRAALHAPDLQGTLDLIAEATAP